MTRHSCTTLFGLILGFLFSVATADARTWHIRADGAGDAPTIQAGIDSAAVGDTVLVAPGLYSEILDTHAKRLALRGEGGPEATVVDAAGQGGVLTFSGGGLVEGLTFRRGHAYHGAGIYISGPSAIVRHNIIEDNVAGFEYDSGEGGGVFIETSGVLLEANTIRNNVALFNAGGIYERLYGNEIRNNVISGNESRGTGGALVSTRFTGNLVTGNTSLTSPGGVFAWGSCEVRNNTIVGNNSNDLVGRIAGIELSGTPTCSHNIVADNGTTDPARPGAGIGCEAIPSTNPIVECNDIWRNGSDELLWCPTAGNGNFSADPLFCAGADGDFHLARNSPCASEQSACGLVGALDVNCKSTEVARTTWGEVKQRYR